MDTRLEEVGCLVPISRGRQEVARDAALPGPESAAYPPRINLEKAHQLVRHMTKWGETGAEFLKAVFFDDDGQLRSVVFTEVLERCLGKNTVESAWEVRSSAIRFLEALEESGLIVSVKSPALHTKYSLNSLPGVSDLLEIDKSVGAQVLETVERDFDHRKAAEFFAEKIGAPCKVGTTCADLASRLKERTFLSTLMKDESLYVDGNHQGAPLRSKLSFYLNEGISAGVIKFERILKDGEEWEVFSLTPLGNRFLG